jgi:F5/8 type C domain
MFHRLGIFASVILLSSLVATTFQIQYSGAQTLVPVSKEFQMPDIELNESTVKGDDETEPQVEEEEPTVKDGGEPETQDEDQVNVPEENETTNQENDTESEEQPKVTIPRKKVEGGLDLDTPGIDLPYKIKVTFDSITIDDDREGDFSGDGEFDLSAFVQGKRIDLTAASGGKIWDAHQYKTYQFNPGTEVTVNLRETVPLSIFTFGHEVDGCGRVKWPGVDDPAMQTLVTTLNQPSAPGVANAAHSLKSEAIYHFKGLFVNQQICSLYNPLKVPNDQLEGLVGPSLDEARPGFFYDSIEYGAGSHVERFHTDEPLTFGWTRDYTLRYTISVTTPPPPPPPTIKPETSSGTCDNNLPVGGVTSSPSQSTFPPTNAIDNNFNTKWWSTFIVKPFITLDLGGVDSVCSVDIAWADGNSHPYLFDVSVSTDGNTFTKVLSGTSTGTTTSPEKYTFPQTQARYLKITITQSMADSPNSMAQISEIDIFGNT